jgi:hypothetical protein
VQCYKRGRKQMKAKQNADTILNQTGNPPALPGRLPKFDSSRSRPWFCFLIVFAVAVAFAFKRLRKGSFEGPATVKPPARPEDTYSRCSHVEERQNALEKRRFNRLRPPKTVVFRRFVFTIPTTVRPPDACGIVLIMNALSHSTGRGMVARNGHFRGVGVGVRTVRTGRMVDISDRGHS